MELMAGNGRNVPLWKKFFTDVTIIDGAQKNFDVCEQDCHKICSDVTNYEYNTDTYDCFTGVWCLGYLDKDKEWSLMLDKIHASLKPDGKLILVEATLRNRGHGVSTVDSY